MRTVAEHFGVLPASPVPDAPPADAGLVAALKPFASGGNWGAVKAWIVAGAPDRTKGVEAAKAITNWQSAAEAALSRATGGQDV
jgi:hypothetical protein